MAQKKEAYLVDLIHGYELSKRSLDAVVSDLLAKTTAERRLISGLNMDRADVIAAGGVVIREVLELSGQNAITVSGQGIREGLFYPYLFPEADHLAPEVRRFSVENLVRRYYDHPEHNQHVQQLSLMLFDQLADLHGYGSFERDLLRAAALLHDIGMAINYYDHHKHSFFLVMSMALPGFSHREQAIIALLVRYHRKGAPTDQGLGRLLEPLDMTRVTKLAALLRLAEYLERSKAQKVKTLQCHLAKGYLQIVLGAQGDAHVEVKEANLHSDLLAMAYGLKVEVVQTPH